MRVRKNIKLHLDWRQKQLAMHGPGRRWLEGDF